MWEQNAYACLNQYTLYVNKALKVIEEELENDNQAVQDLGTPIWIRQVVRG